MTRRATFTEAELVRAWKVARKVGAVVSVEGGAIKLLPSTGQNVHVEPPEDEVAACDKAFGVSG